MFTNFPVVSKVNRDEDQPRMDKYICCPTSGYMSSDWCECQIPHFQSRYFRQFCLYLHAMLCSHIHWNCATCIAVQGFRTGLCQSAFLSHACYMSRPHNFPWFDQPTTGLPNLSSHAGIPKIVFIFHIPRKPCQCQRLQFKKNSRSWQRTAITSVLPIAGQKSPQYMKGSIF